MLDDLRYRLRAIFRRRAVERELAEELRFHIEQYADVEERSGVPRDEALRRARLAFGAIEAIKEESRDRRGVRPIEVAWRDLRYAVRTLARTPAFTVVAILSLTLGIGANTAMFQVLNGLLLRELPVASPQELVEINLPEADLVRGRGNFPRWPAMPYPLLRGAAAAPGGVLDVFAWADEWFNLAPAGEVRRAPGLWVSGDYFPALGLTPALGRLFTPADDRPGCGFPGAVVSHDFWQRELGGDRDAIGRTINVHSRQVDVIGVAPAGFTGLQVGHTFDVALPICSLVAFRPDSTQLTSEHARGGSRRSAGSSRAGRSSAPTRTCARSRPASSRRRCRRSTRRRASQAYLGFDASPRRRRRPAARTCARSTGRRCACCSG